MKAKPLPMRIKLADIRPDPMNPNVTPRETLDKIKANIARTGMYPPLLVRPSVKGKIEPPWISIDGWHRSIVLGELNYEEAEGVVFDVTEREARIMLATINRLHGSDDLRLRAELIHDLVEVVPVDQLVQFIPEQMPEVEDLLRLTQIDLDALERVQAESAAKEEAEAPRAFTVLLFGSQEAIVRQALEKIKQDAGIGEKAKNGDGNALEMLAADYLAGEGLLAKAIGSGPPTE